MFVSGRTRLKLNAFFTLFALFTPTYRSILATYRQEFPLGGKRNKMKAFRDAVADRRLMFWRLMGRPVEFGILERGRYVKEVEHE